MDGTIKGISEKLYELPDLIGEYVSNSNFLGSIGAVDGAKEVAIIGLAAALIYKNKKWVVQGANKLYQTRPHIILRRYSKGRNPEFDAMEDRLEGYIGRLGQGDSKLRLGRKYGKYRDLINASEKYSKFSEEEHRDFKNLLALQYISEIFGGWFYLDIEEDGGKYNLKAFPISNDIREWIEVEDKTLSGFYAQASEVKYSKEPGRKKTNCLKLYCEDSMEEIDILLEQLDVAENRQGGIIKEVKSYLDNYPDINLTVVLPGETYVAEN
jgi:hypothetical protein